jgi:hypothetical protein
MSRIDRISRYREKRPFTSFFPFHPVHPIHPAHHVKFPLPLLLIPQSEIRNPQSAMVTLSRTWYMNADFEVELDHPAGTYRRAPGFVALNRALAPNLLHLTSPGDGLLFDEPWSETLRAEADRREVELLSMKGSSPQTSRVFTPWGWTQDAIRVGEEMGSIVRPVAIDIVARVNSKLWSFDVEKELGVSLRGSAACPSFEELEQAVKLACPAGEDKWVIKSPFGFAARDRVLGRGPTLGGAQATWSKRRFAKGESLLFQPWLEVIREYGVVMEPSTDRVRELETVARFVARRLFEEGYHGPVGIDALEHTGGLHPLLEINARYTMGFVAVAVEQELKPSAPRIWNTTQRR